jgi:hypothetical protein
MSRTHASVTETPCRCGYLLGQSGDPLSPIAFDPLTGEYHFRYRRGSADEGDSLLIIYHCPFCGGAAPKSKRPLLFATIPAKEQQRLAKLLEPIRTLRAALRRLGRPDTEERSMWSVGPRPGRKSPIRLRFRGLRYQHLSDVADVSIKQWADGTVHWQLVGKYVGPKKRARLARCYCVREGVRWQCECPVFSRLRWGSGFGAAAGPPRRRSTR